jgi:hypothetical protein
MAQETLQCHCVTLRLLTASKEAWDRPDKGVTCPQRCERRLLQALCQHREAGTMRPDPWRKKPYFNATVLH